MGKGNTPEEKEALNRFKIEAAKDVGIDLNEGYNGNLTARQAGSIGGQMVKKMIQAYENNMANQSNSGSTGSSNGNSNGDSNGSSTGSNV